MCNEEAENGKVPTLGADAPCVMELQETATIPPKYSLECDVDVDSGDNAPFSIPPERSYKILCVFVCFLFIQMFVNYDAGAIPSVLSVLQRDFGIGDSIVGLLGALPYFGIIVATPFVGSVLQYRSPKRLLNVTVLLNAGSVVFLALSRNIYMLFISRFLIGMAQSGFCIYAPVWIDEFAPPKYLSGWMGLLQGATALGVVIGYLITGYASTWWHSILGQGVVLLALWSVVLFTPAPYIDVCKVKIAGDQLKDVIISLGTIKSVSTHFNDHVPLDTDEPPTSSHTVKKPAGDVIPIGSEGLELAESDRVGAYLARVAPTVVDNQSKLSKKRNSSGQNVDLQTLAPHVEGTSKSADHSISKATSLDADSLVNLRLPDDGVLPYTVLPPTRTRTLSSYPYCSRGSFITAIHQHSPERARGTPYLRRAPSLLVPSPAGAVLETLEFSAGPDVPHILSRTPTQKNKVVQEGQDPATPGPLRKVSVRSMSVFHNLKLLFQPRLYRWTVVTLCALLFVITGIQFWGTTYFVTGKRIEPRHVYFAISSTAATGPAAGVFFGAVVVDRLGGYRTKKGLIRTLWFCFTSGCLATSFSITVSFLENFPLSVVFMWFLLFFGGSVLPPATGILIASVDPSLRPFASSFCIFAYSIFGYALGSFLPGPFISWLGWTHGMKVVFFWSLFGVFGMAMALRSAIKDVKEDVDDNLLSE